MEKLIIKTLKRVLAEAPTREIRIREGSKSGYVRRGEYSFRVEIDLGSTYWVEESIAPDLKNLKKIKKPFESLPDTVINEIYLKSGYGGISMGFEVAIKVPETIRHKMPDPKKKTINTYLEELREILSSIKKEENVTELTP